ncbi:MAG: hypothetical protein WBB07_17420 [Mycobacterium sp.]
MSASVRAEFAARRFWSSVRDALRERASGFSDREAGDFLSQADVLAADQMSPDVAFDDEPPTWPAPPRLPSTPDTPDLNGDPEVEAALAACESEAQLMRKAALVIALLQAGGPVTEGCYVKTIKPIVDALYLRVATSE